MYLPGVMRRYGSDGDIQVSLAVDAATTTATLDADFVWPLVHGTAGTRNVVIEHGSALVKVVVPITNDELYEVSCTTHASGIATRRTGDAAMPLCRCRNRSKRSPSESLARRLGPLSQTRQRQLFTSSTTAMCRNLTRLARQCLFKPPGDRCSSPWRESSL